MQSSTFINFAKYLFYQLLQIISTFFYTYFTLSCEILLSTQHNLIYKTDTQFKTKDTQWYFLIQSIAIDYGWLIEVWCVFPSNQLSPWCNSPREPEPPCYQGFTITIKPTAVCITRTVPITSTSGSGIYTDMSLAMPCQRQTKILRRKIWNVKLGKSYTEDYKSKV